MSRTDIYNFKDSKREGFDRFCMKNIFSNHHHSFQLDILKEHQQHQTNLSGSKIELNKFMFLILLICIFQN